jgi:electron transport complex protein RnfG
VKIKFFEMIKLGLILALFATSACVMLAFVYTGTSAIIENRQKTDRETALKELLPDADRFETLDDIRSPDPLVTIENANAAYQNGKITGVAIRVSRASYSGSIKTLVGVNATGHITRAIVMEHSDTPGLGANAANPKYFVDRAGGVTFTGQFNGKKITDRFTAGQDVIAITASTITSQAVADSVKAAGLAVDEWLKGDK